MDIYEGLPRSFFDRKCLESLQNTLKTATTLGVAFSGGPDSVYLLLHCMKACEDSGVSFQKAIVILHYMHHVRSDDTIDLTFFNQWKQYFNSRAVVANYTDDHREASLRNQRRQWINQCGELYALGAVLTGHNFTDRVETTLLNAIRGTSHDGRGGMSNTQAILRPLLGIQKKIITQKLDDYLCPYLIDPTNSDNKISERNRLRTFLSQSKKNQGIYNSQRRKKLYTLIDSEQQFRSKISITSYQCTCHKDWGEGILLRLERSKIPSIKQLLKYLGKDTRIDTSQETQWYRYLGSSTAIYYNVGDGWIIKTVGMIYYTTYPKDFWKNSSNSGEKISNKKSILSPTLGSLPVFWRKTLQVGEETSIVEVLYEGKPIIW